MKLIVTAISVSCLALFLGAAPLAHASIAGEVWENGSSYPNPVPPSGAAIYGTAPSASFTLSGTGNLINFNSNGSTDYTIGSFLGTSGDTITPSIPAGVAGATLNDTLFQFTGSNYFTAGEVITLTHDDGINLYLNGSSTCSICAGSPTSQEDSSFTIGAAGNYSFVLDYAEVNGAPGILENPNGTLSATPEPSSIALLGTGLLGAAGMIRRRFKR